MLTFFNIRQDVVYDFRTSLLSYYENGELKYKKTISSSDLLIWCVKYLSDKASVILLGSPNETKFIQQHQSKYSFPICCYNVNLPGQNRNPNQLPSFDDVLNSLNEIKALLRKEQPKSANYALINTSSPQREAKDIKELKSFLAESIDVLRTKQSETHYLVSEIYNRDIESSNSGSLEVIDGLRKELSEYKNDFYLKSMQNFGVNIVVEILERLYSEKNRLKQIENAVVEYNMITQIISFCETKIKKMNLKVDYSSDGDEFDGCRMIAYDDKVSTDIEDLKGHVAYSIIPAFYWTLPRVNAPGEDKLLIKEEIVALYD